MRKYEGMRDESVKIHYVHRLGERHIKLADNMSEGETQLRPRETTVTISQ
jgi:hypothetical protein